MSVLLVVLACESLHVCTVCIWHCEHARFCVEVFLCAIYINFHSFIQSIRDSFKVNLDGAIWFDFWPLSLTSNRYDLKQQQQNDLKLVMLISGLSKCGVFLWV